MMNIKYKLFANYIGQKCNIVASSYHFAVRNFFHH